METGIGFCEVCGKKVGGGGAVEREGGVILCHECLPVFKFQLELCRSVGSNPTMRQVVDRFLEKRRVSEVG